MTATAGRSLLQLGCSTVIVAAVVRQLYHKAERYSMRYIAGFRFRP